MRAHEMTELLSAGASLAVLVVSRVRRPSRSAGEQTGGGRCGVLRLSANERSRRGVRLPSERAERTHGPPGSFAA